MNYNLAGGGILDYTYTNSGALIVRNNNNKVVREESPLHGIGIFREEAYKILGPGVTLKNENRSEDYHIDLLVFQRASPPLPIMLLNGLLSVGSAFIIPLYMKVNYDMIAIVSNNGKVIQEYRYEHARNAWIQMIFAFYPPNWTSTGRSVRKVFSEMLIDFRSDLIKLGVKK
jgi:hypothetical protein